MKKRLFDILLGISFISLLGSYLFTHYFHPQKKKPARTIITKANDILRKKIIIPPEILNTTATSSACTLFLKKSAEFSMNDYANEFIDHQVDEILKTCSGAFPTTLQKRIDNAILKCKTSTREKIESDCYVALMEAKTASVTTIIKPDANLADLDSTILLHLLADKFSSLEITTEHPEQTMPLVDALLDKEPNYLSGYKVKLFLLALMSFSKEEENNEIFLETLANARTIRNQDSELTELELFYKAEAYKNNQNAHQDFLHELELDSKNNPKEWIYDYYKAYITYKDGKGDYQQTLAFIENAQKKSPNNPRLQLALENIKSNDEFKRQHPFNVGVAFNLNDL